MRVKKIVYNALIEGLNNFYNPQSVKILECSDILTTYDKQNPYFVSKDDGISHCYIKINAATKLGGSTNEVYCLVVDENANYSCGSMWTWDDVIESVDSFADDPSYSFSSMLGFSEISDYYVEQSESVDVGKLNKALKKHWNEMGLD